MNLSLNISLNPVFTRWRESILKSKRYLPWGGVLAAAAALAPALAQTEAPAPSDWPRVKCERYSRDWKEALARRGGGGPSADFLSRHDAFLASGCAGAHDVCPRSAEELSMANVMIIRAMNAGTASTFPPFGCPK